MSKLVSGTIAQGASTIIKMMGGVILIPLIVRTYNHSDVALWYLLNTGIAFASLLEFGFGPAVSRFFSYTQANSAADFSEINKLNSKPNAPDVFRAFSKIYFVLTIVILIGAGTLGSAYFSSLPWKNETTANPTHLWMILSVSCTINLLSTALNNILVGQMQITRAATLSTLPQLFYLILAIIFISSSKNLSWVVTAHFLGALLNLSLHLLTHKALIRSALNKKNASPVSQEIISAIWAPSWRMGIVLVGAFLINQSSTLLIGRYLPASELAKYGLALQIFSAITAVSTTFNRTSLPLLSRAFAEKNEHQTKRLIALSTGVTSILFISGSICLMIFSQPILSIIGSKVSLPETTMLIFMALYLFLEVNHSTFASIITAKNSVPFLGASLFSGLAIVATSWLSLRYTNSGLWGPMFAQASVQAAYNNWYWPRKVFKDNRINFVDNLKIIINEFNRAYPIAYRKIFR